MDPGTIAALTAAAAGGASWLGQSSANSANKTIAREQMAFQERMSNTAHQRAMADMKAAGINPLVAFSGGLGGASTPTGSSAQMQSSTAAGVSSALQAARLKADIENIRSQTDLNKAAALSATEQAKVNALNAESSALDMHSKRNDAYVEATAGPGLGFIRKFIQAITPFKFK